MNWDLKNKVAVITGGTKGIGLAIANEFLLLGASLIVIARNGDQMIDCLLAWNQKGYKVKGIVGDLTDFDNYPELLKKIAEEKIDILINNVGGNLPKKFNDFSAEEINHVFNQNIISNIRFTQLLFNKLRASQNACVVNISSVAGFEDVGTGSMYAICKASLIQLTKSLAVEWAPYHIRVNGVAPWFTGTDRINQLLKNEELEDFVIKNTPLKKIAQPDEIANAVAFLAMNKSSYITGETIIVDGGYLANQ
ncbi:MAG: SDR family oxidoreductase [Bacteroidota bacterium]